MSKRIIPRLTLLLVGTIALIFISGCVPGEGSEQGGLGNITMIVFLVLILAMMYFTMIRPQRKQQKERREMMSQLKRGDKVITSSGIYGQIESINENSVVLKVESGATIRVIKSSVVAKGH